MQVRSIVFALVLFLAAAAQATPPQTPVRVRIVEAAVKKAEKGFRVQVTLTATRRHSSGPVKVELSLAEVVEGNERGTQGVFSTTHSVDQQATFTANFDVPRAGDYYLRADVTGGEKGQQFHHSDSRYLRVYESGAAELLQPAVYKHEQNLAAPKPQAKSAATGSDRWPLLVNLTVTYVAVDGTKRPLPYAHVEIWEDDLLFDDDLGGVLLDANGRASTTVEVPIDVLGSDDIYLVVTTHNGARFRFGTASSPTSDVTPYSFTSSNTRVIQGSTANIPYDINTSAKALTVWSTFNAVYDYTSTQAGYSCTKVNVWYPGGAADGAYFQSSLNLIAIGETYHDGPMVSAHEYGHVLMWQLNSEWFPEGGGEHSFCPDKPVGRGLAWSEGYATAFALSAMNSSDGAFYWHTGGYGQSIEHYSCTTRDIATDEGRVAAGIWDLFDTPDDDNQGTENKGRSDFRDANTAHVGTPKQLYRDGVIGQRSEDLISWWWVIHDSVFTESQIPLAENVMKFNWTPYEDTDIRVFSWKCVDTPQRCASDAFDGEAYWTAVAVQGCKFWTNRNGGPWRLSRQETSGRWGFIAGRFVTIGMKLRCEGWAPKERIIYAPGDSK